MSNEHSNWVGQTVNDGRFHVHRKLGEGGMGFVYQAHDHVLDTEVVIKVPRPSMLDDPEFKARFARENQALVKLQHPHIVSILFVGEAAGLPYAVMQYLSGGDLKDRQTTAGQGRIAPLPPQDLKTWLPGIARALDFIHSQGFIHRDVKPANILFDGHGNVYLSDFGVAKVVSAKETNPGSSLTGTGMVLGTPEYMAPELIMGEQFDGKVDQYALGISAYEVLCGHTPFEGTKSESILVKQVTQPVEPLSAQSSSCSEPLSNAVMVALAKEPKDRYPNCMAFADAVLGAMAGWSPPSSPSPRENSPSKPPVPPPPPTRRTSKTAPDIVEPVLVDASARPTSETARVSRSATAMQSAVGGQLPAVDVPQASSRSTPRWLVVASFWLGLAIVFSTFLAALANFQSAPNTDPPIEGELSDQEKLLAIPLASHWKEADFTNRLGMKMIGILPGRYVGQPKPGEEWQVLPKKPIWMSECEVSVADYLAFVTDQALEGSEQLPTWLDPGAADFVDKTTSPYHNLGDSVYQNGSPITGIDYEDMNAFCQWLSAQPGETMHYRLPTQEEWVCAYRAGSDTKYYWGEAFQATKCRSLVEGAKTRILDSTRSYPPNDWGFYHMAGNVSELLVGGTKFAGGNCQSDDPEQFKATAITTFSKDFRLFGFRVVAEPKTETEESVE